MDSFAAGEVVFCHARERRAHASLKIRGASVGLRFYAARSATSCSISRHTIRSVSGRLRLSIS